MMKAKVGGVWKDTSPYMKVGGAWKEGRYAFAKVSGVWKKVFQKYPEVTGGTLTSDATYYYRTFTSDDTLSVTGGSLNFDYVLVGGGGGGGSIGKYNHGTCYYNSLVAACGYHFGQCDGVDWLFSCYWAGDWLYCNGLTGWQCGGPYLSQLFDGGGGGAGGVVTGSTTMHPGNTAIFIGAGGIGGNYDTSTEATNGKATSAFGETAYGGGAGASSAVAGQNGANGGGSSANMNGGLAIYGSQGKNGSHTKPMPASGQGNVGTSGIFANNLFAPWIYTPWKYAFDGYTRYAATNGRNLGQPGWGGGAGKAAHHSDPVNDANVSAFNYTNFHSASQVQNMDPRTIETPTHLNDHQWMPLFSQNSPPSIYQYIETVGAPGQRSRMAIWDIDYGIGVTALGLKVAGGGMGGHSARSLNYSYGGGYPMNATTSQGTYSVNGTPNTGGGGGGATAGYSVTGGNGGSGVVRIRYLRSAVGG